MLDRFGNLDIMSEASWLNVCTSRSINPVSKRLEVRISEPSLDLTGLSFNALLLGLYLSHGDFKSSSISLLGGVDPWKVVVKGVGPVLFSVATTTEVFTRIDYLLEDFVYHHQVFHAQSEQMISNKGKHAENRRRIQALDRLILIEGSVKYIRWWIKHYERYLSDVQVVEFRAYILDFAAKLSVIGGESKHLLLSSYVMGDKMNSSKGKTLVASARNVCREIMIVMANKVKMRFLLNSGVIYGRHVNKDIEVSEEIMAPTVHHIPSMSVPFSPFYEHDQELEDKKNVTNNINAALSAEIDFFGGTDALLDQDGEGEGDDGENEPNGGGMPFIPDGKTSFSSPEIYDIWDIDPLEVARQSTLVDQAIFITIPPQLFMAHQHGKPRHVLTAAPVRKFIDRFNAISAWTTASILTGTTAENRAIIYEHMIELASRYEELSNFSALNAVLTGLQQACIRRLEDTLSRVGVSAKKRYEELTHLMAGDKNYFRYRTRLTKRSHDDPDFACVPHLGAHLALITSIDESNSTYINDSPHLMNLSKLYYTGRALEQLIHLQEFRYKIKPVRSIAAAFDLHLEEYVYYTQAASQENSRKMFELSIEREPLLKPKIDATPASRKSDASGDEDDDDTDDGSEEESSNDTDDSQEEESSNDE